MTSGPPVLLAVDGNSLGHRAFHGVREDTKAGGATDALVTGAVVTMLASAWVHGPYDAVAVAFDHAENRRKLVHPEYKANRPETAPELVHQLVELRSHLADCGFAVLEHDGAEADDVLTAVADACAQRAWRCDVLSSDRDLTALVGPTTRLLRPRATFADLVVEDEDAVREAYGIEPAQYTDLAALRGDPSDGLEGARGIGPKTAARLLRDHGSIPGVYAALADLAPRIEASLREARERVERNLLLMAPLPHLPVDVEGVLARGLDHDRVVATLHQLGLAVPARRFTRAVTGPPPPPMPPPPERAPDEPEPRTGEPRVTADRATPGPRVTQVAEDRHPSAGEQVALF